MAKLVRLLILDQAICRFESCLLSKQKKENLLVLFFFVQNSVEPGLLHSALSGLSRSTCECTLPPKAGRATVIFFKQIKKKRQNSRSASFDKRPFDRKLILLLVLQVLLLLQVLLVLLLLLVLQVLLVLLLLLVLLVLLLQVLLQELQFFLRSLRKKLSLKERGK